MLKILNYNIQDFISANLRVDLHSLLLKKSPFDDVSMQEIVQQINGRKIAEKKFPFLLKKGIVFPPHLNLEQCSSEQTGNYKKKLLAGRSFIDLTSGFGVDAYHISDNFSEVFLLEQNTELLKLVEHNWVILGKKAIFINQATEAFLEQNNRSYDAIFIDPARRDTKKNKVFLLEDLSPNILEIQDKLLEIGDSILIKLSPLIDIQYLISVLKNIQEIHIIAVKNDVKEVLVLLKSKKILGNEIKIICENIDTNEEFFSFEIDEKRRSEVSYSEVQKYIYIPNNSVLKSGAFNLVAERFNLHKLHPNTHLYTSDILLDNFCGRVLEMDRINPKSLLKGSQFNIITKNYPLKPEEVKKKYKIKDGGNQYLIFTQDMKGKVVLQSK